MRETSSFQMAPIPHGGLSNTFCFFIQSLAFPTQFQKVESVHPNQSGQNSDSSRASDSNVNLKENMAEVLRENPEIIINALKGHGGTKSPYGRKCASRTGRREH